MECFIGIERQLLKLRVFLGVVKLLLVRLYSSLVIFQCLFNLLYYVLW